MFTKVAKLNIGLMVLVIPFITSCATVFGGFNYDAYVTIPDNSTSKIIYKGKVIGEGNAYVSISRFNAGRVKFTVNEAGCKEKTYQFHRKSFRTGAFISSFLFTPLIKGTPIPIGIAIDLVSGAVWKPNYNEEGVHKIDYKSYQYELIYDGCKARNDSLRAMATFKESSNNQSDNNVNSSNPSNKDKKNLVIIYFLSGKAIRGEFVSEEANVSITIKTSDGSVQTFKMDEIEKIKKVEN